MTWKTPLACVVCLILGLVVGRFLPVAEDLDNETDNADRSKPKSTQRVSPRYTNGDQERSATREVNRDVLVGESGLDDTENPGALVVVPSSLLDEMSRAKGSRSLAQDLFSRDGKLEAYLQITDKEKSAIQRAWRQSQSAIRKLEKESARTEDLADGSVRITLPDLSDGMKEFGNDFKSQTSDVLGGNRAEAFLAVKQIGSLFSPSAGERVYTVKTEAVGNGRWRYHMRETGPGGSKTWVGETVPAAIRHITDAARINPNLNPPELEDDEE